jgi:hypothetical protein
LGAEAPKKPAFWGDDLNGVQTNPDPPNKAPVTVTDPDSLARPIPSMPGRPDRQDGLLDPEVYARLGEEAGRREKNLQGTGEFPESGFMFNLGQMLHFAHNGSLDAGVNGDRAYGNYTFGVYNAGRGATLPETLDLANLYGKLKSSYDPKTLDPVYKSIPTDNVQNITRGYNDYRNGTLRRP